MPVPSAGSSQQNALLMIDLLLPLPMLEDIHVSDSPETILCLGHHSFGSSRKGRGIGYPSFSWTCTSPKKFKPPSIMPVLFMEIFGHPVTKQAEGHDEDEPAMVPAVLPIL